MCVSVYVCVCVCMCVQSLSEMTAITLDDIQTTLQAYGVLRTFKGEDIVWLPDELYARCVCVCVCRHMSTRTLVCLHRYVYVCVYVLVA